jgi:hypothetical protein
VEDKPQRMSTSNKVSVYGESDTAKVEGKQQTDLSTKTPNEDMLSLLDIESHELAQLFEWSEPGQDNRNSILHHANTMKGTLGESENGLMDLKQIALESIHLTGWNAKRRWSDPEIHCASTIPQLQKCYHTNSISSHKTLKRNKENLFLKKYISRRSQRNKKKLSSQLSCNSNDFFLSGECNLPISSIHYSSSRNDSSQNQVMKFLYDKIRPNNASQFVSLCSKKLVSHPKKSPDIFFCSREMNEKSSVKSMCSDTMTTTAFQDNSCDKNVEYYKFLNEVCESPNVSPDEQSSTLKRSKPRIFSNASFVWYSLCWK